MLRKIRVLATGIIIITASTTHANFYGGAGIGSDTVDFNLRSRVTQPNPGFLAGFDVFNKSHSSATGVFGTLFAGYGRLVYNKIYLAGEVNGNVSSTQSKSYNYEFINKNFTNTDFKIRNSAGISLLPGYQLTPDTLFYARLGINYNRVQVNTADISLANFNKNRSGFRYGVGIKQAVTDRVALRMDYSRVQYSAITSATFDIVGGVSKVTQMTPTQQLIEFGVVFNFA